MPVTASSTAGTYTYSLSCVDASGTGTGTTSVSVGPVPAPTVNLIVTPSTVQPGQVATLVWSSTNATSCTASGGDTTDGWSGAEKTSGTFIVTAPTVTGQYSYILTCTGPQNLTGAGTAILTVSTSATPTVTLTATPTSVAVGGSSDLTWSSTNVQNCTASSTNPDGSAGTTFSGKEGLSSTGTGLTVGPFATAGVYNYTLACGGTDGTASASATVVVGTPPSPTVTLTVKPTSIQPGQSATITWTSTNATSCTASGSWSGGETLTGTASTGTLTTAGAYSYTLTCEGPSGSAAASGLLTVSGASVVDACGVGQPTTALLATSYVATPASSGLCLLCSVGQPQNVVTPGASGTLLTKPFSVLNTTVDLLGAESLLVGPSLTNTTPTVFPAGRKAGFIVAAPDEVLTANLITGFTVTTFLAGVQQDSAQLGGTGSSGLLGLLNLDLLTLPIGNVPGGYAFLTTTKPFDSVLISNGGLLSVIGQLDVYQACITNQ